MEKKFQFGPIQEKLDEIEVQGQETGDCSHDCHICYFVGDSGGVLWGGCTKKWKYTSEWWPFW